MQVGGGHATLVDSCTIASNKRISLNEAELGFKGLTHLLSCASQG